MRRLACAYAVFAALGTVIGVRNADSAAPFGIRTGRSTGFDAVVGYGTALSAPWPMVLLLLAHAGRRQSVVRILSVIFLVGAAGERSTWEWKGRPGVEQTVIAANFLLPAWMLLRSS